MSEGYLDSKKCVIYCIHRVGKLNFINMNRIETINERAELRVTYWLLSPA